MHAVPVDKTNPIGSFHQEAKVNEYKQYIAAKLRELGVVELLPLSLALIAVLHDLGKEAGFTKEETTQEIHSMAEFFQHEVTLTDGTPKGH